MEGKKIGWCLTRISYLIYFWTGAGLSTWWLGGGVGIAGAFLGMFSGIDLYWSLHGRPRRFWLMPILGAFGIGFGLLYEFLISIFPLFPMPVKIVGFGSLIGCAFGLVSGSLGWMFGAGPTQGCAQR